MSETDDLEEAEWERVAHKEDRAREAESELAAVPGSAFERPKCQWVKGCVVPAAWEARCMSMHKKPRLVVTHWCDAHAEILRLESPGGTWERLNHTDH